MELKVLLAVLGLSITMSISAYAVENQSKSQMTREKIDDLNSRFSRVTSQKEDSQDRVGELILELAEAEIKRDELNASIDVVNGSINNLEHKLDKQEVDISQAVVALNDAKNREAEQMELFRSRVRSMEESSQYDYWTILFKAKTFHEALSTFDFIAQVMDYDQSVIDKLKELEDDIKTRQAILDQKQSEMMIVQNELYFKRDSLYSEREILEQEIFEIGLSKEVEEANLLALSGEIDSLNEEIDRLTVQLKEEEEEERRLALEAALEVSRKAALEAQKREQSKGAVAYSQIYSYELTDNVALGGYVWPVNSRRITSTFGGRASPGGIGSTNHKGVDIGGVGYGTAIHAAKAGKVVVSGYVSGYGNYVVVSHGAGNKTGYAHMSKRSVSVGDWVEQGDILGLTGSTGNSTGPHLHFEIVENNIKINPLKYLSGYHF